MFIKTFVWLYKTELCKTQQIKYKKEILINGLFNLVYKINAKIVIIEVSVKTVIMKASAKTIIIRHSLYFIPRLTGIFPFCKNINARYCFPLYNYRRSFSFLSY